MNDIQIAASDDIFAFAWNEYRRRRRWFYSTILVGLTVLTLLAFLTCQNLIQGADYVVICPIWMLACLILSFRLSLFKCPRCNLPFFSTWWWYNEFARRCVHCGLSKWAKNNSPEEVA